MDRRIPFCGVAALICLALSEVSEDSFRGIALFFAGLYAFYTLLFALDEVARRRRAVAGERHRRRADQPPAP